MTMEIYVTSFGSRKFRTTFVPDEYVLVEALEGGNVISMKKFVVGDMAEYDSFNLSYYGPIVSITKKLVFIEKMGGNTARVNHKTFAWRNWDFDITKASMRNAMEGIEL